jgi:DNA (cytosine-5)-methyltransferase 1
MATGQAAAEIVSDGEPSLTCNHEAPIVFGTTQITSAANYSNPKPGDPSHPLAAGAHAPAIAFQERGRADGRSLEYQEDIAYSLNAPAGGGRHNELRVAIPIQNATRGKDQNGLGIGGDTMFTLDQGSQHAVAFTVHGTREGTMAVATETSIAGTVREGTGAAVQNSSNILIASSIAFAQNTRDEVRLQGGDGQICGASGGGQIENDTAQALRAGAEHNYQFLRTGFAVRRLMPVECERLQGFPDGYTRIPWRGKPAADCPDGPRYKALGNSMAVPVMRWIGERIEAVCRVCGV